MASLTESLRDNMASLTESLRDNMASLTESLRDNMASLTESLRGSNVPGLPGHELSPFVAQPRLPAARGKGTDVLKQPAFFPLVREELPLGTQTRVQAAYRALEELWDALPPGEMATDVSRLQSRLLELSESLGGSADLDVYGLPRGAFAAYPDEAESVDRLRALRRGRTRR